LVLLASVLPISRELKMVLAIEAAMPAGMFTIVLVRMYGADAPTAIRVVVGSSIGSLLTIPVWISCGTRILGLS
jgi:predicted permease